MIASTLRRVMNQVSVINQVSATKSCADLMFEY
jgi:hypothetical protein